MEEDEHLDEEERNNVRKRVAEDNLDDVQGKSKKWERERAQTTT
jgi:hypothetical protein